MPLFEVWVKNRKLRMNEPKYVFAKDESEAMAPFKEKAIQAKLLAQDNEVLTMISLDEVKELVLKSLMTEYKKDDAEKQVEQATITISENIVTVTYDNHAVDKFKLSLKREQTLTLAIDEK